VRRADGLALLVALLAVPLSDVAAAQKTTTKVEIVGPLPVPVTGQLHISNGLPYQHRFEFTYPFLGSQESTVASDSVLSSQRLEVHFIQCYVISIAGISSDLVVAEAFSISSSSGVEWVFFPSAPAYYAGTAPDGNNSLHRWAYSGPALLHFAAGDLVSVKAIRAAGGPANTGGACTLSGVLVTQ
jgi:hypothetical protein